MASINPTESLDGFREDRSCQNGAAKDAFGH
jgi:hypothetical protein